MPQSQVPAHDPQIPELLRDIVGFASENLRDFVNHRRDINTLGTKVYGGVATDEEREAYNQAVKEDALSFSPAGAGAGIIRGINTPAQKKIVRALARKAPELLKAMVKSPRTVTVFPAVDPNVPTASGVFRPIGEFSQISIHPKVLRGQSPVPGSNPSFGHLPAIAAHEGQHFVNLDNPLVSEGTRSRAFVSKTMPVLPSEAGGKQVSREFILSGPGSAADEALAYLRQLYVSGRGTPEANALAKAIFGE